MAGKLNFPFQKKRSDIFGTIHRPVAYVNFWSTVINNWVRVAMIVDTGADYTLLPHFYAHDLGINLKKDCKSHFTFGIGGRERVHIFKEARVKLGSWERTIPVGFLERDNIPPLLGRQDFLEVFDIRFSRHITSFSLLR